MSELNRQLYPAVVARGDPGILSGRVGVVSPGGTRQINLGTKGILS